MAYQINKKSRIRKVKISQKVVNSPNVTHYFEKVIVYDVVTLVFYFLHGSRTLQNIITDMQF